MIDDWIVYIESWHTHPRIWFAIHCLAMAQIITNVYMLGGWWKRRKAHAKR